jgi:hypothetical protein
MRSRDKRAREGRQGEGHTVSVSCTIERAMEMSKDPRGGCAINRGEVVIDPRHLRLREHRRIDWGLRVHRTEVDSAMIPRIIHSISRPTLVKLPWHIETTFVSCEIISKLVIPEERRGG